MRKGLEKNKKKQKQEDTWIRFAAVLIFSAFNFVELEICNGSSLRMPFRYMLMNTGVMVCFYAVIYALSGRIHAAIVIGTGISTGIGILNYYVIAFRGTPVSTRDLKNFKTALSVAANYNFTADKRVIAAIGIGAACIFAAVLCRKKIPVKKRKKSQYWKQVFFSVLGSLVFLYVCFFSPYSLKPKNTFGWSWETAYYEYGFLAESLEIMEASWRTVSKPADYSEKRREEILKSIPTENPKSENLPHIILILNESWYDLETIVSIDCEEITPYINRTENALRGYSMVPMVGTNLSEYELLTGNSLQLMQGITPFNSLDLSGKESMVSVLKRIGYHTAAMHPAIATNYSRNIAYPAMGFDDILFIDDFKREWEVNPEELNTVSVENDFGVYREMTEEYLSCLQRTDVAWKELIDYFETVEEPTIVCMVGDHAPSFADTLSKYWSGKTDEELAVLLNATPYIIWANYDWERREIGDTSIHYLGAAILELAGIQSDAYYNYMNEMRKSIPVMSAFHLYLASDGRQYYYTDENEYQDMLNAYFILEYGRVK